MDVKLYVPSKKVGKYQLQKVRVSFDTDII